LRLGQAGQLAGLDLGRVREQIVDVLLPGGAFEAEVGRHLGRRTGLAGTLSDRAEDRIRHR
jgi:hypothetical protein